MLTKPPFWVLIIEILICFIPISLLWLVGSFMIGVLLFQSIEDIYSLFFLPSAILFLLGGIGLVGIIQIVMHISDHGYQQATVSIYRKLYTGILSLILLTGSMIFGTGSILSPMLIVFLMPIICSLHLISITKKTELESEISMFNDA
jgi:hypothetical protein